MMEWAALLGWSEKRLMRSTPRFFINAVRAFLRHEETHRRQQWEIARFKAYYIAMPYMDKDDYTVQDIVTFAWEQPKQITSNEMTPEELEGFLDFATQHFSNHQ